MVVNSYKKKLHREVQIEKLNFSCSADDYAMRKIDPEEISYTFINILYCIARRDLFHATHAS